MARAIWSGSISFGLLNVPVKLYSAVSKKSVSFRELRESDSSRIRHKRVAEADGEEVDYGEIVKGYEIAPEQYVVITRDELEEIDPKKTRAIEIQDFVDLDDIDPIYFDHPYYLGPDKGAEKAYGLLVKAMEDAHKVAIARFVLRNKENLAALRPMDGVMTMATMRFADEVVSPDEISETDRGCEQALEEGARHGEGPDRVAHRGLRRRPVPRRVSRGAAGADRAQGQGRGDRRSDLRGAAADEGPRPDGGARGEPRRGQGRGLEAGQQAEVALQELELAIEELEQLGLQVDQVLEPIAKQGKGKQVEVDGRELALTNLDKVLWPARSGGRGGGSRPGFTKGEALDYYARIAETILPHLRDRALTRVRFPDGVDSMRFYEKRAPKHTPDWVRTEPIEMDREGILDFIVCDERATLVWLAQLAALELHPSLAFAKSPRRPTVIAFDLDPGDPATAVECARVALRLRQLFGELGLESFAKHSGSKGIQVYVPLNTEVTYDRTKTYARAVARALEQAEPGLVVSQQKKELRKGKVLVDWSQNDYSKTTVAVYSLRYRQRPWASTPLKWSEVETLADDGDPASFRFEAPEVLARVEEHGDLFAPVLELEQDLPESPGSA